METTVAAPPGARPASCEITRLPEDILVESFARAGPVAACRVAAVCRAFHGDLPPFAAMELSPPTASKKELSMRLSDGLTSMCLHRETGAVCYIALV